MPTQLITSLKCLATLFTRVSFLSLMSADMFGEIGGFGEGGLTAWVRAYERFRTRVGSYGEHGVSRDGVEGEGTYGGGL